MTLGSFVSMLASYAFVSWLNTRGGTQAVGFYQAGYTMVDKYAGLVFAALGMEFYPRLSRVAGSDKRLRVFVSHEINIALMVLAPILMLFVLLRVPLIHLLYRGDFDVIATYISWGAVGTLFRAVSWCMAFVMLAKGHGKIFLVTETVSAATVLVLNMLCYSQWGVDGLGYAYILSYIIYTAVVAVVYFGVYRLKLNNWCWLALLTTVTTCVVMVLLVDRMHWGGAISLLVLVAIISARYTWLSWKG